LSGRRDTSYVEGRKDQREVKFHEEGTPSVAWRKKDVRGGSNLLPTVSIRGSSEAKTRPRCRVQGREGKMSKEGNWLFSLFLFSTKGTCGKTGRGDEGEEEGVGKEKKRITTTSGVSGGNFGDASEGERSGILSKTLLWKARERIDDRLPNKGLRSEKGDSPRPGKWSRIPC